MQYYEEELVGEAYFNALTGHFEETEKLAWLARVERKAAQGLIPLLTKYKLTPRDNSALKSIGESQIDQHKSLSWRQFMKHIVASYPDYLIKFTELENTAPAEDLPALQFLTEHEVITIEFAKNELSGATEAIQLLMRYVDRSYPTSAGA